MWMGMRAVAVYLCGEQEGEGQAPHSCEVWGGICGARCEHSNNDTTITNTFQHNTGPQLRSGHLHTSAHSTLTSCCGSHGVGSTHFCAEMPRIFWFCIIFAIYWCCNNTNLLLILLICIFAGERGREHTWQISISHRPYQDLPWFTHCWSWCGVVCCGDNLLYWSELLV